MASVSENPFADQLRKLRAANPDAVQSFIDTYEPYIRRAVRRRLANLRLSAAADSVDICQSAMGSFLLRMAAGQFEFDNALALENLLLTIARRKLAALARREFAERRNRMRTEPWSYAADRTADVPHSASRHIELRDLIDTAQQMLPVREHEVFELRKQGLDWNQIADRMSLPAAVLRKRLSRALRQVAIRLRLDDVDE
jgi:RNA polymerase sigma factor (sigma-70 family)